MNFLKKITPFLIAGMFLGSTVLAADLGTWTKDAKGDIYVGAAAATQYDGAAALNIANALGLVIPVSGNVTAGAVTDSVTEDKILLETALSVEFGATLDDSDLDTLQDTTVEIDDEDISVHDEIALDNGVSPSIETSASSRKEYGASPVIETAVGALGYYYVFDEVYNGADDDVINDDNPLTLDFMGKSLIITDIDVDEITAQVGDDYVIKEGETVTVTGHTVLVDTVSEDEVYVFVDGVGKLINEGGATVKFGSGDSALRISCKTALYSEKKDSKAILIIGEYATETYADGDEYIIPCSTPKSEDCSKDDPDWVWDIELGDAANDFIGVTDDFSWNTVDEPVLKAGDSLLMPGSFISLKFDSLKTADFGKYTVTFDDTYDLTDVGEGDTENVFIVKAVGQTDEGMTINAIETDEIILWYDGDDVQGYYVDDNNEVVADGLGTNANIVFTLDYGDSTVDVAIVAEDNVVTAESGFTLWFDTNDNGIDAADVELFTEDDAAEYVGFGTPEESEAEDAYLNGVAIGDRKYDVLFSYGSVMKNPDDSFDGDEVTLSIPDDVQEATATIATHGVGTTGTTSGWVPKTDAETPVAGKPLIAVGGSAINKISAQLLGLTYPTYGTETAWKDATKVDALGKGIIKIIDNSTVNGAVAMLVAGYEGSDTVTLATILKEGTPALTGKSVLVNTAGKTLITA
jgi:hypothetical protein